MTKTDFEITKKEDLKNSDVPECMYWSCDQVCEFFEHRLNLPEYKVCFHNIKSKGHLFAHYLIISCKKNSKHYKVIVSTEEG